VYLPLPIPSGWEHLKATTLSLIHDARIDFSGASVTIPHKEHMLKLIQEERGTVDLESEMIGAVNTISTSQNLLATNTDASAIATLLDNPKRILVLGGGGVARAAIAAAISLDAEVVIVTRRSEQACQLADAFKCDNGTGACLNIDTVINCTPVGMKNGEDPKGNPLAILAPSVVLTKEMTVFDTVYMPEKTPLVQCATEHGCKVITGREMFRKQATSQQLFWTTESDS
jgi:shikimate 5-dehydrogenase